MWCILENVTCNQWVSFRGCFGSLSWKTYSWSISYLPKKTNEKKKKDKKLSRLVRTTRYDLFVSSVQKLALGWSHWFQKHNYEWYHISLFWVLTLACWKAKQKHLQLELTVLIQKKKLELTGLMNKVFALGQNSRTLCRHAWPTYSCL